MAKTPEELEKMFSDLNERQGKQEKEFQQKLEMAERNTQQFKELADKNAEELRTFKQDAEKREKEQKEALFKSRETEISEFVESQVKVGKILPALKEKVLTFMKSLTSEGEVLKFAEKDGSTRSHSQFSLFKELILKMKPVMPVGNEFSVQEELESETPDNENGDIPVEGKKHFTEIRVGGELKKVEVDEVDIAAKAYEYQEKQAKIGKKISYEDALIAVYPRKKSAVKA
jgi:hypothetical protein